MTEEKITNALIKITREKSTTLCTLTGHGEASFGAAEPTGYSGAKATFSSQAYELKELNVLQEGKIPETCDGITIVGPTKSFSAQEVDLVKNYLLAGGRAVVAIDLDLNGGGYAPELATLMQDWFIKLETKLIVEPVSRMLGFDESFALLVNFAKDHSIVQDFQGINCLFPLTRPITILSGQPAEMRVQWLAQSTPKSLAVADTHLSQGQIRVNPETDKAGPFNAAVAAEGKLAAQKGTKATRLVVFGSSSFANNNYARLMGNADFFANAVSWALEDDNLISIRAKEDEPAALTLSTQTGTFIFLLVVIFLPLSIAILGFVVWFVRRRL